MAKQGLKIAGKDGLVFFTSLRQDGNMSLKDGETSDSLSNRKAFLKRFGIDHSRLVLARQVHGTNVAFVGKDDAGKGAFSDGTAIPDTDALVTNEINLPIAVLNADCLPVCLYDAKVPALALVHSGWRGTKDKVVLEALNFMLERLNCRKEDIYAYFGPSIRGCSYEVGGDLAEYFPEKIIKKDMKSYIDLAGINKAMLTAEGIKEENINDLKLCTHCDSDRFFSYRKIGKSCGRMISVAMIKKRIP